MNAPPWPQRGSLRGDDWAFVQGRAVPRLRYAPASWGSREAQSLPRQEKEGLSQLVSCLAEVLCSHCVPGGRMDTFKACEPALEDVKNALKPSHTGGF